MKAWVPDNTRSNAPGFSQQSWADQLVAGLLTAGIGGFVLSPGSRNTPLSLALARGCPERVVIHQEERGAAFFALGASRSSGKPWGVVCTSGSAVANWMPAVVEASASRIPLILLSADRPEYLHHQRANQTMEQVGLFGAYARLSWNLNPPTSPDELDRKLRLAYTAYAAATGAYPGPVHLNLPFDEPLVTPELPAFMPSGTPVTRWSLGNRMADPDTIRNLLDFARPEDRGILVIGGLRCPGNIRAVRSLAVRLGWPVYADITSGLRLDPLDGLAIPYADLLPEYWAERLGPAGRVLWIGDTLVQRAFPEWLARSAKDCLQVTDHADGQDPYGMVRHRIIADPEAFCRTLAAELSDPAAAPEQFDRERTALDHAIDTFEHQYGKPLSHMEPLIARWTLEITRRQGTPVFAGNSMPVRWCGLYGKYEGGSPYVSANRGVSGIDGNVATAAGLSAGMNRTPVVALLGDLTVFHDLPSLAFATRLGLPLILVVLNNGGGGIFHHLPQARYCPDLLIPWFTAGPSIQDFRAVAEGFGWPYACPDSREDFQRLLEITLSSPGPSPLLVEVKLDGLASRATHEQLKQHCAAFLSGISDAPGRTV